MTVDAHPVIASPEAARAHAIPATEFARSMESDLSRGLSEDEAARRLAAAGPNRIPGSAPPPAVLLLARQFWEPMSVLLTIAALVSGLLLGEWIDAGAILAIVLLNALIGAIQEGRAASALEALRDMETPMAEVVRGGRRLEIPSDAVVPGDLIVLTAGDAVPADARLVTSDALRADESMLTGESLAVDKRAEVISEIGSSLADRRGMVFSGTLITAGSGRAIVAATGMATEMGRIASALGQRQPPTPLQRQLAGLSRRLGAATIAVSVVVLALVVVRSGTDAESLEQAFLVAVALAVAAVPEGLPTAVAVGLALGVRRMADRGAIVRRLTAVETLGSATVLLTDKTGTLTQNRMAVVAVLGPDGSEMDLAGFERLARIMATCNDASLESGSGDPVDLALLGAADRSGHPRSPGERVAATPFDSGSKKMSVVVDHPDGRWVAVKGAPEVVLELCSDMATESGDLPLDRAHRGRILDVADRLAATGERILAFADRQVEPEVTDSDQEDALTFVGLVALRDPVRETAGHAVAQAQGAGVRILMVTGDHVGTARSVAGEIGLVGDGAITGAEIRSEGLPDHPLGTSVYARVDPDQKLGLVEALQASGEVVAVTGDGINDAPALHRSDIGVAMGRSGSDVARQASDVIVTDDDLSTIVTAIREGRGIYDNIRKVVDYLVAGNLSEITVVVTALLAFPELGIPLTAIQLLWINLLTDGLPALALGIDPTADRVMLRPPRPTGEVLLGLRRLGMLMGRAVVMASGPIAALIVTESWLGTSWETARTTAFLTLVLAHLLYAFVVRQPAHPLSNRSLVAAIGLAVALAAAVVLVPPLRTVFDAVSLGLGEWALVLLLGSLPVASLAIGSARRSCDT